MFPAYYRHNFWCIWLWFTHQNDGNFFKVFALAIILRKINKIETPVVLHNQTAEHNLRVKPYVAQKGILQP
ncbi:hypothetical protein CSC3H3_11145 [Thalassospira marina]|uniref:Uncharacterized protein n=1 Tax=Thalassospira marina TaxID=2048283 RepID=A0A2N3KXB9_9PROT|nr:hypothetical protein CSC3H3_11145 [Thalassospira marina]PKR55225.1 hypothetical protein COO20_03310 [Thalassospira marina]